MKSFSFNYRLETKDGGSKYDVVLNRKADSTLFDTEDLGRLTHWLSELSSPELLARDIGPANPVRTTAVEVELA